MKVSRIIASIFSILFNYLLYTYLTRLENIGCECVNDVNQRSTKAFKIGRAHV